VAAATPDGCDRPVCRCAGRAAQRRGVPRGAGVAANRLSNRLGRHTTLFSDDEAHGRRRKVLMRSLAAKALADIEPRVDARADALIERLLATDWFEAATQFSAHIPLGIVAELVGVPEGGERLLRWAAATFDVLGPMNRRGMRSAGTSFGLLRYTRRLSRGRVRPGSWAASVFDACERGELSTAEARALCIDFIAPALDTTILASTHLLWTLANQPDAWQQIRDDPALVPRAVVENVRLASPIRGFTRQVIKEHEVGGVPIPAGARVVLLFGAANLDETRFPNPESYDIHRPNGAHVGWGNGPHACAGANLANLEMQALLRAMVPHVGRMATSNPTRLRNNTLQGFSGLTARFN
jgi:cytochrome P450